MTGLERRIERAERSVGVEERELPALIIRLPDSDDALPHFPKPIHEWLTVQRAMNQARRERVP